nr:MAG TPA: hypothetical protein [Caudoviricetes sp.]
MRFMQNPHYIHQILNVSFTPQFLQFVFACCY